MNNINIIILSGGNYKDRLELAKNINGTRIIFPVPIDQEEIPTSSSRILFDTISQSPVFSLMFQRCNGWFGYLSQEIINTFYQNQSPLIIDSEPYEIFQWKKTFPNVCSIYLDYDEHPKHKMDEEMLTFDEPLFDIILPYNEYVRNVISNFTHKGIHFT